MKKTVHYLGLDVHKETLAVAIAPENSTEVRHYGMIGGTLAALDKLIKKLQLEDVELRFVYEAGSCGYGIYPAITRSKVYRAQWLRCNRRPP